jgi:hypothetical protein
MNAVEPKLRRRLTKVYFGTRLAESGACVHLQNYKSMPHVFIVFERLPSAEMGYSTTSVFVRKVTRGEQLDTTLEVVHGKFVEGVLDPGNYPIQFTKEEVWPALGGGELMSRLLRGWRNVLRNGGK